MHVMKLELGNLYQLKLEAVKLKENEYKGEPSIVCMMKQPLC